MPREVKFGAWLGGEGKGHMVIIFLLLAFILAGCDLLFPAPTATPTPPPTATLTTTPTIVWFPPTHTPTLFITQTPSPTPERKPGVGTLLLEDDFSDLTQWQTVEGDQGNISYGNHELTIAIPGIHSVQYSLRREPVFTNYYLEITVTANLCGGTDSYGLLLRASSGMDFYRLLISCDGNLRLERLQGGQQLVLVNWTPFNQVPPEMMFNYRLSVWHNGREMRFFINDVYQFSASDGLWQGGGVGVFARSDGKSPLTVSFSNLVVRSVEFVAPKATPAP